MHERHDVTIGPLELETGIVLPDVTQRVAIYGDPSARAVLVPHALTGSSTVHEWWSDLVGPGKPLDTTRYCVIGINALGSCYGSTGPGGKPGFPRVTVRDIAAAQARALDLLGIAKLHLVIGASLGGMQALQWALDRPTRVESAIMVGSHDHQSAMGIALNAVQREAIALDPRAGLRLARKIAMLSYKSEELFKQRHERRPDRRGTFNFDIEGYLEHQAALFEARMEAYSYVALTQAMDSFDVRHHDDPQAKPALHFIGIGNDWLFRPQDVRAAAQRLAERGYDCSYDEIESEHGHDAFLAEPQKLISILRRIIPV